MELENLNKKKIIFIAIAAIIFIFIVIMFLTLEKSQKNLNKQTSGELNIWIYNENKDDFYNFVEEWKQDTSNNQLLVNIDSFDSWEEYNLALASAIAQGKTPDIFMLNSSEKSIFEEQITLLDHTMFNPDEFRNAYNSAIGNRLIYSFVVDEKEKTKEEYVIGVPVGYESLGIFYNRLKGIQASDFDSWAALNKRVQILKEKKPYLVPIGIGRGKTVYKSSDIISQFLMLESIESIDSSSSAKIKSALNTYFMYADSKVNGYDEKIDEMESGGRTNLDYFSRGEIAMVVGYPRTLLDIDKNGFRKSALYVRPFPGYYSGSGKSFIKFNYFVINKDAQNETAAVAFLQYLNSDKGAGKYLKKFTYYLPAKVSLEEEYLDKKILEGYNIKVKDFNNENLEKSIFDKKIKLIYDREIVGILDDKISYLEKFLKLKNSLLCKYNKIINLESLSVSCKK